MEGVFASVEHTLKILEFVPQKELKRKQTLLILTKVLNRAPILQGGNGNWVENLNNLVLFEKVRVRLFPD
ncbi:MAG: hypothetical protein JEZ00_21385 [Anaerolineaceae bacterium]|nr:hypothetical protein [Anaerolineaceae bacterium]